MIANMLRRPLGRDIALAMVLKLALLSLIYLLFFRADARLPIDAGHTAGYILGSVSVVTQGERTR